MRIHTSLSGVCSCLSSLVFCSKTDSIVITQVDGTIEYVNRALKDVFGWAFEEVVGRNVRLLMNEVYAQRHDTFLQR